MDMDFICTGYQKVLLHGNVQLPAIKMSIKKKLWVFEGLVVRVDPSHEPPSVGDVLTLNKDAAKAVKLYDMWSDNGYCSYEKLSSKIGVPPFRIKELMKIYNELKKQV